MTTEPTLHVLIDDVHALGPGVQGLHDAEAMLDYCEYELAYELVLRQLHALRLRLKAEQLVLIQSAATRLHIPAANYQFVHQMLR